MHRLHMVGGMAGGPIGEEMREPLPQQGGDSRIQRGLVAELRRGGAGRKRGRERRPTGSDAQRRGFEQRQPKPIEARRRAGFQHQLNLAHRGFFRPGDIFAFVEGDGDLGVLVGQNPRRAAQLRGKPDFERALRRRVVDQVARVSRKQVEARLGLLGLDFDLLRALTQQAHDVMAARAPHAEREAGEAQVGGLGVVKHRSPMAPTEFARSAKKRVRRQRVEGGGVDFEAQACRGLGRGRVVRRR